MSAYRIASRYAKSLLDLAVEQNQLDAVAGDVRGIQKLCDDNKEFLMMLKSPIINADKKESVLRKGFEGKINPLVMSFLDVVLRKKREKYVPEIMDAFIEQFNKIKRITKAKLTTALPADEAIISKVEGIVKKHCGSEKVELSTAVDPSLIGGFVLKFEDKLIDASIANKLNRLRQQFSGTDYIKNI